MFFDTVESSPGDEESPLYPSPLPPSFLPPLLSPPSFPPVGELINKLYCIVLVWMIGENAPKSTRV